MNESVWDRVTLVAAIDEHRVIGRGNGLIWRLPSDMKFFKSKTMGHTIVMGRKTFESMGSRPLPGRKNIVLSSRGDFAPKGCLKAGSLEEAFELAGEGPIDVIGGGKVFEECLPKARRMLLTQLHHTFEGDAYFPEWNPEEWRIAWETPGETDLRNPYLYTFREYVRAPGK
ncbi:dihydrofolate reductase [Paenibacillus thermotolerans]|uniref:dihydrofolate reductase n=1 Tax=Paenibacillus thermotolerans TaxID=3027807 RepID=UPI0023682F6B|nr:MULTISPECIES: dihydrofolate reductase [unclassified Paenibacillus]